MFFSEANFSLPYENNDKIISLCLSKLFKDTSMNISGCNFLGFLKLLLVVTF